MRFSTNFIVNALISGIPNTKIVLSAALMLLGSSFISPPAKKEEPIELRVLPSHKNNKRGSYKTR